MINSLFANSYNGFPFGMSLGLFAIGSLLVFVLFAAIIVLKGYSLWNAARRGELVWFIVLLVVNTMGILELIYLFFVVKKGRTGKTSSIPEQSTPTPPPATPNAQ